MMGGGVGARGYLPCLCCLQTLPLPPPHPFLQTWSLVSDGSRQETSLKNGRHLHLYLFIAPFFSNSDSDSEKKLVVLLNFNSYQAHSKHKEKGGGEKEEERKMKRECGGWVRKRDGLRDRDREIHRGSRRLTHLDHWPSWRGAGGWSTTSQYIL